MIMNLRFLKVSNSDSEDSQNSLYYTIYKWGIVNDMTLNIAKYKNITLSNAKNNINYAYAIYNCAL